MKHEAKKPTPENTAILHVAKHRAILHTARRTLVETPKPDARKPKLRNMALLWLLLSSLILSPSSFAATVTGNLLDITGSTNTTTIQFNSISTPLTNNSNLIYTSVKKLTATNGIFSTTLLGGDYRVTVGPGSDSFRISVPTNVTSYNITTLITTNLNYTFVAPSPAIVTANSSTAIVATVTGQLVDTTGASNTVTINFKSLSTPIAALPRVIYTWDQKVICTNGALSVQLFGGNYLCTIQPGADKFWIAVPNTNDTFNIISLVTSNLSYLYTGTALNGGSSSSGLTNLNGLDGKYQLLTAGTSGSDFNISSSGTNHTFNLPSASATVRGALLAADWTTFNNKASTSVTNGLGGDKIPIQSGAGNLTTLTNPTVQSSITVANITASRAAMFNASKQLTNSPVSDVELGYVAGVTSAIQTQIDSKVGSSITNGLGGDKISIQGGAGNANSFTNPTVYGILGIQTVRSLGGGTGITLWPYADGQLDLAGGDSTAGDSLAAQLSAGYANGGWGGNVIIWSQGGTSGFGNVVLANQNNQYGASPAGGVYIRTNWTSANYVHALDVNGSIRSHFTTANRVLITSADKGITNSPVTSTEIGYVGGVTSAIQTQLDGKNGTITIQTNGVTLATGPTTVNWTTGVTGSVSGAVATLGINVTGGSGSQTNQTIPNFVPLQIQSGWRPSTNMATIEAGYLNWELQFHRTNAAGANVILYAHWPVICPTNYITNTFKVRVLSTINSTNGPNSSNVIWRASLLRSGPGGTSDIRVGSFGSTVTATNTWAASNSGTNIVASAVIDMGTSALMGPGDYGILKLERVNTSDTFVGTSSLVGLGIEYDTR